MKKILGKIGFYYTPDHFRKETIKSIYRQLEALSNGEIVSEIRKITR